MSRRRAIALWTFVGVLLMFTALAFLNLGRFLQAPARAPVRADLIVALGGDVGYRISKAYDLYRLGYGSRILVTGAEGSPEMTRDPYLGWRAKYLVDKGVPRDAILFDSRSSNSRDEAFNTLHLMMQKGWHIALVVSDPPHLRRLSLVWGSTFSQPGMEFVLVSSDPEWWDSRRWWVNDHAALFVFAEVIKIIYHWFR